MDILITLAAGTLLIVLGMRLIHRLNAQHDARIAAYHLSDPFPAISRPPGHSHHRPTGQATPAAGRTREIRIVAATP